MNSAKVYDLQEDGLSLADQAYTKIKQRIFDFDLMPGTRLAESELAQQSGISRTPLRQALQRLQHEGFVEAVPKVGWRVPDLSFQLFDELYDFRIIIETFAVQMLCATAAERPALDALAKVWHVGPAERPAESAKVATLDEAFHLQIVEATGNSEMLRTYLKITERMRIVRRLDFIKADRIETTFEEHSSILTALQRRRSDEAQRLLRAHVEHSKLEVRKITLDMLYQARKRNLDLRAQ